MSNFAQIITSFERAGNFPIEANYIFPTVEDLKQFYSDSIQAVTLHKGLLKIVERNDEGKQALYWVTKKATNDELEFTELVAGSNIEEIQAEIADLQEKLAAEAESRKAADTALWGIADPSDIDPEYNSINDLVNQLKATQLALKTLSDECLSGDDSLKNQIKAVVGTTDNEILEYLNTLPYKSITELANELDRIVNAPSGTDPTDAVDTLKELTQFLEGYTNKDTLKKILEKLWFTIEGEVLPSESFRTLRGVEDYLIEYKTANDYKQETLLEELNNIETAIGLNADGSYTPDSATNYLQGATSVMNALQILDKLLHKYISANVPSVRNDDEAVKLSLTQELDSYVLSAALKLSTQAGNQLIKNTDGLYTYAKTYYDKGTLTFMVNGNIVSQHYIGMSAIVQSATYDKDNEQLVFVFKLDSGDTQTVQVPVGALIREWEVENKDSSPVILERTTSVAGTDRLSADVNLSTQQFNILVKDGNTLYVKGTTDNIYHGGTLLSDYISLQEQDIDKILESLEAARLDRESIKTELNNEVQLRTSEIERVDKDLTNHGSAILELQKGLTAEVSNRQAEDLSLKSSLETAITTERQRASTEENRLQLEINSESERANQVEQHLSTVQQSTTEKLSEEITRSVAVDQELANKIANIHHPEYTVVKQSTPEEGCVATYLVTKDGEQVGNKIDIPEVPVQVSATYVDGVLTLVVNGNTIGIFDLGLAAIVKDSYYDATSDELVFEYNLHNSKTQVVRTSLRTIIDKIDTAVDILNAKIDAIKIPEYTMVKQAVADSGNFATYVLTKDNEAVGQKINIPEQVGVSADNGNQILEKVDGFYMKVGATYTNGVLSILVNDSIVNTFNLGLSSIVSNSYYDSTTEELVIVYNLHDGTTQTVRISVHSLIQEWEVVNTGHTVSLTKTQVINGTDKLSADVNISNSHQNNILQADSTGLYVEGTARNIITDSTESVQAVLDNHAAVLDTKAPIDSPRFTGIPQVVDSPASTDSSQRIAPTAWVKARMDEVLKEAKAYAESLVAIEWIDVTDETSSEEG